MFALWKVLHARYVTRYLFEGEQRRGPFPPLYLPKKCIDTPSQRILFARCSLRRLSRVFPRTEVNLVGVRQRGSVPPAFACAVISVERAEPNLANVRRYWGKSRTCVCSYRCKYLLCSHETWSLSPMPCHISHSIASIETNIACVCLSGLKYRMFANTEAYFVSVRMFFDHSRRCETIIASGCFYWNHPCLFSLILRPIFPVLACTKANLVCVCHFEVRIASIVLL